MRRKDATYVMERAIEGYAEVSVYHIYRQYHGGRDLVATLPRRERAAARLLVEQLNCGHGGA